MSSTERLERYLTDAENGCESEAVAERLSELEEIDAAAGAPALDDDVEMLSALASETRYRILRILHIADEELCVCEFAPLLDVSDSAISHALSQLTDAGLITRKKEGKWRKYRTTARATAMLVAIDGSREF